MKLYNSLTKKLEEFKPLNSPKVTMYACGPTVYDYLHIGNLRTATLMDVTRRALVYLNYKVSSVMNITDVDDKIENRAKRDNITVDELTSKYEKIYLEHIGKMNISADIYPHASDLIKEQIEIIEVLLEKGFAYKNEFGIYFDITKDEDYGKLGNTFKSTEKKSRIGTTEGKRNEEDFALWKFPIENEARQKLWESPWEKGFPGWHIECSAMSMKYLSHAFDSGKFTPENYQTIDIHIGGEDIKQIHHENEVAQSECATDKQFVKYWLHGAMLNVGEEKMSKSLGNFFTLEEVIKRKYDPLALRYLYFTTHYRKQLVFTWESLDAAQNALNRLRSYILNLKSENQRSVLSQEKLDKVDEYGKQFTNAISDDLNMPEALAAVWEVIKSNIPSPDKYDLIMSFDEVLGLKLNEPINISQKPEVTEDLEELIQKREDLRKEGKYEEADKIREELANLGYTVKDAPSK